MQTKTANNKLNKINNKWDKRQPGKLHKYKKWDSKP